MDDALNNWQNVCVNLNFIDVCLDGLDINFLSGPIGVLLIRSKQYSLAPLDFTITEMTFDVFVVDAIGERVR